MEQRSSTDSLSLKERIRSLGFNPEQLTPEEQVELLTLHLSLQGDSSAADISVGDAAPSAGEGPGQPPQLGARSNEDARVGRSKRTV